MTATVSISRIEKHYGGTRTLKGVSLDVAAGEFLTLVGPSGCGKSTLLRIIAGLVAQDGGQIAISGAPVDHLPPKSRDVAMVFQNYALYPHMTVFDNIATPLRVRHLPIWARLPVLGSLMRKSSPRRRAVTEAVHQVASQVEIEPLLARRPAQLSGGQRQRVALARAMVRQPRVFLMDEPLSNLDARLRVHMRGELSELHRRLGATFIYVTHDQVEAMTMSSRVAVMMDGEIVQVAAPHRLYQDPVDVRVARFIGSPEINLFPGQASTSGRISLRGRLTALIAAASGPVTLGLRAEALHFAQGQDEVAIEGRLQRIETLGHDVLVHLAHDLGGDGRAVFRIGAAEMERRRQVPGFDGTMLLGARAADLLVFDADGRRVTARSHDFEAAAPVLRKAG
ncbi:multiple sugar transport system ATP-binding protein [Rhodoligotrophos appendicifer]|uniref:ABC transporter ATP-binding protein n=1 Tax=Rhodoligotrophos appendicifer TaxID=987056 RepID=UPI0011856A99|nr:ABC transporter ATP-binding protein [Rhodoligotrophos appendicifer]